MRVFANLFVILTTVLFPATGYSSQGFPEKDPNRALVYAVRVFAEPTAWDTYFLVDGQKIAEIPEKHYSYAYVAPGRHQFSFDWVFLSGGRKTGIEQVVEAGKTYVFELRAVFEGMGIVGGFQKPGITQFDEQPGIERIQQCCQLTQPIVGAVAVSKPDSAPSGINYRSIFSGKTVSGVHTRRGYRFQAFFKEDGTIIHVKENGGRSVGEWTVDEGGLQCIALKNKKGCGYIKQNKDGSYSAVRDGSEVRRYLQFKMGNML